MRSSAAGSSCASLATVTASATTPSCWRRRRWPTAGEQIIDLGAGVGAAGLAVARRTEGVAVTLVEIDPALAALANENAARNALAERVRAVCLDVAAPAAAFAAAGLAPGAADRVLMNPPFNAPQQQPSPDPGRRLAHSASRHTLDRWVGAAARLLRPAGVVTLIWRADALASLLAALTTGFGAVTLLPIHPKPGVAAIRCWRAPSRQAARRCRYCPASFLPTRRESPPRKPRLCCAAAPYCHWLGTETAAAQPLEHDPEKWRPVF